MPHPRKLPPGVLHPGGLLRAGAETQAVGRGGAAHTLHIQPRVQVALDNS